MQLTDDHPEHQHPMQAEPVAVIGLACRFAGGVGSPDDFWDLLIRGGDGVGEVPADRWRFYEAFGADYAAALRSATRFGSFLSDIDGFDADFFGLSPREAELMDPQQRILLEVAWEALEHAGIPPLDLAGTDAGVFVGIGSDDYGRRLLEDLPHIDAWSGIGAAMCAAANRISHALDLRGPSLAVDTACSSSLVATHLACQSLRLREGPVALAAGVNLIISPGLTLTLDAAGALAGDGRCKSFDAAADGYGRGEGCGVLVLKLLSDAQRDGDRPLAIICGSAINQDGRTNGIMAPSGAAQEHVLQRACDQAGVAPAAIGYVEAHGTGTRLGDPIEAAALGAVYGRQRAAGAPCRIGSVKSNIGHLEAAAGVASIIKVVLALEREELPASISFSAGNPTIDWDAVGLEVVTEHTAWPRGDAPRVAATSSFGYGGTIAHVVIEEAPAATLPPVVTEPREPDRRHRLFPISGNSDAALRQHAAAVADWLSCAGADAPLADVGHTLARRRSHLTHRAAVVAATRDELIARLRTLSNGDVTDHAAGVSTGVTTGGSQRLMWVFSGHGSQWTGMGHGLLASDPVFASTVDRLEPIVHEELGWSPRRTMCDGELETVDRIHSTIFVMQLGLAAVWESYGVRPDAVIGHSVGEIAAAVIAGALSVEDGTRLACRRANLLRRASGMGAMALAGLTFDEVEARLGGRTDVAPAIWSSPATTVISGDADAVRALVTQWRAEGVVVRPVASDIAFHSPHMDPLLADVLAIAADLTPRAPRIPRYTTALLDPRSDRLVDNTYWVDNLRNPVRLAAAVRAAAEDGYRRFVEISPHPIVTHSISESLSDAGIDAAFIGASLRRSCDEPVAMLANVGALHCHGADVDWTRLQPEGALVTMPRVAWQHRPHWRHSEPRGDGLALDVDAHVLLGAPVEVAGRSLHVWRAEVDAAHRPYPGDHTIGGLEVIPGAVVLTTLLRALPPTGDDTTPALHDVVFHHPLTVGARREVQVLRDAAEVRLSSRATGDDADGLHDGAPWVTHATATVAPVRTAAKRLADDGTLTCRMTTADPDEIRHRLAAVGVPTMAFVWAVERLDRAANALRAVVTARHVDNATTAAASWAPLLDAALSVAPATYPGDPQLRILAGIDQIQLAGAPPQTAVITVRLDPDRDRMHVLIADDDHHVIARLSGVRCAAVAQAEAVPADPQHLAHEIVWKPLSLPAVPTDQRSTRSAVLVGPHGPLTQPLLKRLEASGLTAWAVDDPDTLPARLDAECSVVVVPDVEAMDTPQSPAAMGQRAVRAAWLLTRTAQRLVSMDAADPPRLWCVTAGVRSSSGESPLALASLWGLGRVIAGEHPALWGGVVDLDWTDIDAAGSLLADILAAPPGEDVIAVDDTSASVPRLARVERAPVREVPQCHADSTYLITGGLGALGGQVARWLAQRGARRIVLAGRRPVAPRADWEGAAGDSDAARRIAEITALERLGVTVRVVSLDIAEIDQVARALSPDALGMPPIRGVVHAAGVLDNRLLADVDEQSLRMVMRPKIDGAFVLHRLFPPGSIDFLVLFSSCGHLLGMPGQATYGSANAFLDALAIHRTNAGGDDTLSFGWTSWRSKGMAINAVVDAELRARGVSDISSAEAFSAWEHIARRGAGHQVVLRTLRVEPGTQHLPLLSELPPVPGPETSASSTGLQDLRGGLPPEELRDHLIRDVGSEIASEMRVPADHLDPERLLVEQGLDSVMTLLIRRRLEARFQHPLPAALLWHSPTVVAIADHLVGSLSPASDDGDGVIEQHAVG